MNATMRGPEELPQRSWLRLQSEVRSSCLGLRAKIFMNPRRVIDSCVESFLNCVRSTQSWQKLPNRHTRSRTWQELPHSKHVQMCTTPAEVAKRTHKKWDMAGLPHSKHVQKCTTPAEVAKQKRKKWDMAEVAAFQACAESAPPWQKLPYKQARSGRWQELPPSKHVQKCTTLAEIAKLTHKNWDGSSFQPTGASQRSLCEGFL